MKPLMKCGHAANATNANGDPCCVICGGLTPLAEMVEEDTPSLENRLAVCVYCKVKIPSSYNLAFFEYNRNATVDRYYCGCRGWE